MGMSQQETSRRGKIFAGRLRTLRSGRKKAEFQRFLGINSPVTYQNYEDGRIPESGMLEQIADRCGCTVDWLLGRTEAGGPVDGGPGSTPAALHGAASASALAKDERQKRAAFATQDSARVRAFVALAEQLAPALAGGREVDYCAERLRSELESLIAWGKALEEKPDAG